MTVMIVEDQKEVRYAIRRVLEKEGHRVGESDGSRWREALDRMITGVDLVVLDVMLGTVSGIDILKAIRANKPHLPVILITAYTTPENIIEASRLGVKEILQKPFESEALLAAIQAHEKPKEEESFVFYRDEKEGEAFIGSYESMGEVFKQIGMAASNTLGVLIQGATGTGKEMIARMIYRFSERKEGKFVVINCASLPPELFEETLFGRTGSAQKGALEETNGGVLLLDEIDELPKEHQGQLLRFLETHRFSRSGEHEEPFSDTRIIASTAADLRTLIQEGHFREELYYRLAQLEITLPRLQERLADMEALAYHFLAQANRELGTAITRIQPKALQKLREHSWEGNIRELLNTILNAALHASGTEITEKDIRLFCCKEKNRQNEAIKELIENWLGCHGGARAMVLSEQFERSLIEAVMALYRNNISQSAVALGISRNTLKAKLKYHNLYREEGA